MKLATNTGTIFRVNTCVTGVLALTLLFSISAYAQPRQKLVDDSCVNPQASYECTVDTLWQQTIHWLNAWVDHDTAAYFAFYAPETSPVETLNYQQWQQQRTLRVAKKTPLKLAVNFLDAQAVEGRKVRILFIQRYDSGNYRDIVLKTLVYQLLENEFFIIEEIVHQTLSEQDAQTILDNIK